MRLKSLSAAVLLLGTISIFAQRPDVVLVTLDTFRADRLAAFGGDPTLAPALNALAAKGRVQTDCFTLAPLTLPAHASMMTGCFPNRTGLRDNGIGRLSSGTATLAELFSAAGYRTQAVVASSVLASRYGLARGFDYYDDSIGPSHFRSGAQVTDRALEAVGAKDQRPLFLWVHYFDAHEPYAFPPAFSGRGRNEYDHAVAYLDSEVARLLSALPKGTIVAVASDHGEALGEHGEETHGVLLYQPTVHALLMFSGPNVPAGMDSNPCTLCDLAPTLTAIAGLRPFKKCDGSDLLSAKELPPRRFPLETMLPFDIYRWLPLFGVTDGRYKWVRGAADHLYDLSADPGETKDLAKNAPPAAEALRAALPGIESANAPDSVDSSLRGLGYAPVPGGKFSVKNLPDPETRLEVLSMLRRAQKLRTAGDFEQAAQLYGQAVANDQSDPSARFDLGETQRRLGQFGLALKTLDEAINLAPKMEEAWSSKGLALVPLGKADEAAQCFRKALEIDPQSIEAVNSLSAYLLDKNLPLEAIPLLERAVASGTANSRTYILRGRVRLVQGKDEEAKKDFTSAMLYTADPPATLYDEANIYMILKKIPEGVALYQEGMARYPNYAPNYLTLASYLVQADAPDKALPLYKRALKCDLDAKTRKQVEEIVQEIQASESQEGAGR